MKSADIIQKLLFVTVLIFLGSARNVGGSIENETEHNTVLKIYSEPKSDFSKEKYLQTEGNSIEVDKIKNIKSLKHEQLKSFLKNLPVEILRKLKNVAAKDPVSAQRFILKLANERSKYTTKGNGNSVKDQFDSLENESIDFIDFDDVPDQATYGTTAEEKMTDRFSSRPASSTVNGKIMSGFISNPKLHHIDTASTKNQYDTNVSKNRVVLKPENEFQMTAAGTVIPEQEYSGTVEYFDEEVTYPYRQSVNSATTTSFPQLPPPVPDPRPTQSVFTVEDSRTPIVSSSVTRPLRHYSKSNVGGLARQYLHYAPEHSSRPRQLEGVHTNNFRSSLANSLNVNNRSNPNSYSQIHHQQHTPSQYKWSIQSAMPGHDGHITPSQIEDAIQIVENTEKLAEISPTTPVSNNMNPSQSYMGYGSNPASAPSGSNFQTVYSQNLNSQNVFQPQNNAQPFLSNYNNQQLNFQQQSNNPGFQYNTNYPQQQHNVEIGTTFGFNNNYASQVQQPIYTNNNLNGLGYGQQGNYFPVYNDKDPDNNFWSKAKGYFTKGNKSVYGKVFEMSIGILAFLAFAGYIVTLIYQVFAASGTVPLLPIVTKNIPGNPNPLGVIFGRSWQPQNSTLLQRRSTDSYIDRFEEILIRALSKFKNHD